MEVIPINLKIIYHLDVPMGEGLTHPRGKKKKKKTLVGAITVKWTSLDPCSGVSESDPKIYTKFEFYEIEIHKHLENIWIYKAKQFMFTKNNFKQRISILEDGASDEQVGDIEKIIVKTCSKFYYITWNWWIFKKKLLWPQVYNEIKAYEKKIQVKSI